MLSIFNLKKRIIYPNGKYNKLSQSCKEFVNEAVDDPQKQYEVWYKLVYGTNDFPKDIDVGIKYIKKAIKGGSIDAVILYNRMLIIGKKITGNVEQATKNLHHCKPFSLVYTLLNHEKVLII